MDESPETIRFQRDELVRTMKMLIAMSKRYNLAPADVVKVNVAELQITDIELSRNPPP
jgi:protein involved in polysaccharide export with SLBB domain